jgi:hypothetical protein
MSIIFAIVALLLGVCLLLLGVSGDSDMGFGGRVVIVVIGLFLSILSFGIVLPPA